MALFDSLTPSITNSLADTPVPEGAVAPKPNPFDEKSLLDTFDKCKKEAFAYRWVWEREWLRDIFYTANRQWIYYHPVKREWVDKRLAKNVPKPVTNKMQEIVQSLRSSFGQIDLGVVASPIGHSPQAMATAEIIDNIAPLIHDEHKMNQVMREADFWFIVTGNACLQVSWENDTRFNRVFIPHEECATCHQVSDPQSIIQAGQAVGNPAGVCPACGGTQLAPATGQDGNPAGEWRSYGRGKTMALSPFEFAFPPNNTRFDEIPYIIRLRWRDRSYYEANHPELVSKLVWENSPQDRSLQIYKSLTLINDLGSGATFSNLSTAGNTITEGVTEYELWMKPTPKFPEGLVLRVVGDRSPIIVQSQDEGIPGPVPFKDSEGMPLWPFSFAPFEQMGGRLYGRSALSPLIQKQDQLNQLDSLIQMIVQRMANPVWIIPEGAGIDKFTGDPGLVVKWQPLAAGGQAKPERIAGENIPVTLFKLRDQYVKDIEELSGTYDILKGNKPAGVEAFSALQLLVEKSQARFTSAYKARGEMYRQWFSVALELERAFGPQTRAQSVVSPNKGYTFQQFEKAQLQGNITIHIEDGTDTPKTFLGRRAAIEHANQLGLLNPEDPDQKYSLLTNLGLADLVPSIDVHVQTALQLQDSFERWVENPVDPTTGAPMQMPLQVKPWYNVQIHYSERIKWLNTDHMREILQKVPQLEQVIDLHLQELQMSMMTPPMGAPQPAAPPMAGPHGGPPPQGGGPPQGPGAPHPQPQGRGAGNTMSNSNANSGTSSIANGPPQR